jgi:hypothetical protein
LMDSPNAQRPLEAPAADAAPPGAEVGEPRFCSHSRIWMFGLIAGVAAGLASWLIGETMANAFPPEKKWVKGAMGMDALQPTPETLEAAEKKTSLAANGVLGAVLGLCLGMAGGFARGSKTAAPTAAMVGMLLGLALGDGLTLGLLRIYFDTRGNGTEEVTPSLLIHMAIWSSVAGAGGLAFGLGVGGHRRVVNAFVGGVLGGAFGAAIYELVGCAVLPMAHTTQLVSTTPSSRLLARLLVCMLAAIGATLAVVKTPQPMGLKPTDLGSDHASLE